jgi:hypothetical protein
VKRTKLDIVVSKLVRERAEWKCERCEKYFPEGRGRQGLDASHLYGRRHKSTRWHPDNIFAHCRGCHQYLGSNPPVFAKWALDQLGETRYDWLMRRHNQVVKYTKADLEEMYQHYKAQLAYLERRRRDGEKGYIDFVGWD